MAVVRRWGSVLRLAAVLGAVALDLAACFDPQQPGCAFSCATDGLCPSGYTCQADNICHRNDGQGTCTLTGVTGDAGGDGPNDAGDATP
jgi:hypothetical protein